VGSVLRGPKARLCDMGHTLIPRTTDPVRTPVLRDSSPGRGEQGGRTEPCCPPW
jgi:hypothetical protein